MEGSLLDAPGTQVRPTLDRPVAVPSRVITVGGTTYPVFLPKLRDPRLHVAAVVVTIHVLGQVGLQLPRQRSADPRGDPDLRASSTSPSTSARAGRSCGRRARCSQAAAWHSSCATRARRPGDHWTHPRVVPVRRHRRVLAADQVGHPVPGLTPVQPLEPRARHRVRRARQHAGRAARFLVGSAQRVDDHGLHRHPRRRAS